jgi:hypothetical protein
MAVSSGLAFETVGAGTSRGSWRCTCATLACTSWSARSTFRDMSNMAVTRALPCRDCDVICWMPSTCEMACSRGSVISRSTADGDAPGQLTETLMLG